MNPRHRLFDLAFKAIALSRAERWLAPFAQGRGVILTFHHVRPWREREFAPNRLLEITPDFLDTVLSILREKGFEIVALDDVPERLKTGDTPFAALTFDDGYRDNRDYALPVLRRYDAPWTMFVTTDFASGQGRLWWLELEEAVARLDRIAFSGHGLAFDLPCRTPAEKTQAFGTIYRRLRAGPEERLRAVIAELASRTEMESGAFARLCLNWEELAVLAVEPGLSIGAHSLSHPMLAKHADAAALREIGESRHRIEARLGRPVRHFAYPVGDPTSAGWREFDLAREAGFATAVTTRPGHLFCAHADHLHALPRISVNGLFQTEAAMKALLSGVPFWLWNRGRRLNVE